MTDSPRKDAMEYDRLRLIDEVERVLLEHRAHREEDEQRSPAKYARFVHHQAEEVVTVVENFLLAERSA